MSANPAYAALLAARGGYRVINPEGPLSKEAAASVALDGDTFSEADMTDTTPPPAKKRTRARKAAPAVTPVTSPPPASATPAPRKRKPTRVVPPPPPVKPPAVPDNPLKGPPPEQDNPQLSRIQRVNPALRVAFDGLSSNMAILSGETAEATVGFLADEEVAVDGLVYELVLRIRKAQ